MSDTQQQIPIQPVEQPVICSPYLEPDAHWDYDKKDGSAIKTPGRRLAGYWYQTKKVGTKDQDLFDEYFQEENFDDLPLINLLREDVRRWRESGYRGATNVTKELLNWWRSPNRSRPLFFCQIEAVETLIYLAEIRIPKRASKTGFRKFALSESNLDRLLNGERPVDEGEVQLDRADGKTKTFHPFAKLADATFFPTLVDAPLEEGLLPLRRMGCKMATGSGKTVVMTLLISWAFCNRGVNPNSKEFPNGVLVCCPNLTVKERLKVLRPEDPDNYYAAFDLVPITLRPHLQKGKVIVENWHRFTPESEHKEGDKSYAVVNKGPETAETLSRRVLGDLYDRLPIMVLNDEGHHCWRPAPADQQVENVDTSRKGKRKRDDLSREEAKEIEEEANEARVWLQGLDSINNCLKDQPGILYTIDLSATPFYIKGSGFSEGQPFPWLVSDFGLVDAIESGITKIPRLPVKDESDKKDDAGRPDPKYFRLWRHIVDELKKVGETFQSGKPKPEACYREAEGALIQLSDQWKQKFDLMREASPNQEHVPPVMIVVCDNTQIADCFYKKISGESESDSVTLEDIEDLDDENEEEEITPKKGKKQIVYGRSSLKPEFANTRERKYTIRIDVDMLRKAESDQPGVTKQKAEEELRRLIATVGKRGEPGEHVRCVISVAMLTEGWDANNVTQILGIRAFGSQLLCEQVVGRGLRRMNYHPEPDATGKLLLPPEYVDVYGIPFTVIPYKGKPVDQPSPDDRPKNRVWAVPDREEMEIRFPLVDGYVFQLTKGILRCDFDKIEDRIAIEPEDEPTATYLSPAAGYVDTPMQAQTGFEYVKQDRQAYYANTHFQTILFLITTEIINDLQDAGRPKTSKREKVMALQSRHQLFPQVYGFVQRFVKEFVDYNGVDPRELGLQRYTTRIKELLTKVIYPDDDAGEPPLVPVLDRYRPTGTTGLVDFVTTRPTVPSLRSHINSVVLHSTWEGDATTVMDSQEAEGIISYFARNDHLGLTIPYEHMHVTHKYEPDFLVRLTNGVTVLVEVKGHEHTPEQNAAKHQSAKRWVSAVNNMRDEVFGQWDFLVCRDVEMLLPELAKLVGTTAQPFSLTTLEKLVLQGSSRMKGGDCA